MFTSNEIVLEHYITVWSYVDVIALFYVSLFLICVGDHAV